MGYASPTTTASYAYDALERRIAKVVDGIVTAYVYDTSMEDPLAFDDIVMEFDTTGGAALPPMTRRWVHSNAVDEPVGFEGYVNSSGAGSGVERAVYADRQGSVIWVTDPAKGEVVAGYEYDGYGAITQTVGTLSQPYGYTGREYDAESGMYHYRARSYDPGVGVFLQSDPIEFGGGQLNTSSYVGGSPFTLGDPSGLFATVEWRNLALGSAALAAGAAWTASHADDKNSTLFGSIIGLGNMIAMAMSDIEVGTYPYPMSDAGPASMPPDGKDPCKGLRRQLREHLKKFEEWQSNPYAYDNLGLLRYGNPLLDMFHIISRSISLRQQVMTWTYRVRQCEEENAN